MILEHVSADSNTVHTINVISVSLNIDKSIFPESVSLEANYPNPFNPSTKIPLTVFKKEKIAIAIYDSNGAILGGQLRNLSVVKFDDDGTRNREFNNN